MAIEEPQFRIIRDPKNRQKWAYERLVKREDKHRLFGGAQPTTAIVGGFSTAQAAKAAFDRAKKAAKSLRRSLPP